MNEATFEKMDPEAKAVWLKALRSNKYKQSFCSLAILNQDGTDSYCALGVLMNELGTGEWLAFPDPMSPARWLYVQENGESSSESLTGEFSSLLGNNEQNLIIHMNDGYGKSFAEIADWIEKNL